MASDRLGLVFVHGATLNGRMWDPIREAFAGRYQTAAPDLPGHGTLGGEPFTMARAIEVVASAVAALEVPGVVLIGDSLGSYTSLASAAGLGSAFRGAVLGGATARFHGTPPISLLLQGRLMGLLGSRVLKPWLEDRVANEFKAGRAAVAGGIRTEAFSQAVRELRAIDFIPVIRAIAAPLLFVNGESDRPHRRGEGAVMAAARRARLVVMPGIGHGVSLRRPDEFAALIGDFVAAGGPLDASPGGEAAGPATTGQR